MALTEELPSPLEAAADCSLVKLYVKVIRCFDQTIVSLLVVIVGGLSCLRVLLRVRC